MRVLTGFVIAAHTFIEKKEYCSRQSADLLKTLMGWDMHFLRNISIHAMVLAIVGTLIVIWGIASGYSIYSLNQATNLLTQGEEQKKDYSFLIYGNDQYFRAVIRLERAMDYMQDNDQVNAKKTMDMAQAAIQNTKTALESFKNSEHIGIEPTTASGVYTTWEKVITEAVDPMNAALQRNDLASFRTLFREVFPPMAWTFGDELKKYSDEMSASKIIPSINEHNARNRNTIIIVLLAGIMVLVFTEYYLRNYLVKPIAVIKSHLAQLTAGRLGCELIEFGRNCAGRLIPDIKLLQSRLRDTVTAIRDTTRSIDHGTSEIKVGSEDLSRRTEQQAAALQETAASMEQLSSTVKHNADNVHQARLLAQDAAGVAKKGGEISSNVAKTMAKITSSSSKISDITNVINGIAFQTNILALNAAVEAARGGEQGRGFAVVASEVRSLAQRSAQAAKEIAELIAESEVNVQVGDKQVQQSAEAMETIITAIAHVSDLIGEINAATDEQTQGITQVGQAVHELDGVTQQNAALVQESTAAVAQLDQQSHELANVVALFQLEDDNCPITTTRIPAVKQKPTPAVKLLPATRANNNDGWEKF